eukprot:9321324-Alexandrium_andersonii.AAC.1
MPTVGGARIDGARFGQAIPQTPAARGCKEGFAAVGRSIQKLDMASSVVSDMLAFGASCALAAIFLLAPLELANAQPAA